MYSEEEQMYSNNGVNGAGGPEAALNAREAFLGDAAGFSQAGSRQLRLAELR